MAIPGVRFRVYAQSQVLETSITRFRIIGKLPFAAIAVANRRLLLRENEARYSAGELTSRRQCDQRPSADDAMLQM